MKSKHYAVEHIHYQGDERGLPTRELDDHTFQRRVFQTEGEARKYIDDLIKEDPAFVEQWVAKISLICVKEKIEIFFP
jgi:hypothetical protein